MLYHAGGKVTVNGNTYMDQRTSDVIDQYDTYIRTTVTREENHQIKTAAAMAVLRKAARHTVGAGAVFKCKK